MVTSCHGIYGPLSEGCTFKLGLLLITTTILPCLVFFKLHTTHYTIHSWCSSPNYMFVIVFLVCSLLSRVESFSLVWNIPGDLPPTVTIALSPAPTKRPGDDATTTTGCRSWSQIDSWVTTKREVSTCMEWLDSNHEWIPLLWSGSLSNLACA